MLCFPTPVMICDMHTAPCTGNIILTKYITQTGINMTCTIHTSEQTSVTPMCYRYVVTDSLQRVVSWVTPVQASSGEIKPRACFVHTLILKTIFKTRCVMGTAHSSKIWP